MKRNNSRTPLIQELIEEIILTFRELRVASSKIHGAGAAIPDQRGVLMELTRLGPQTVAAMARTRGASRQHIQALVNQFASLGMVEFADNPAHRRSRLVRLTNRGEALTSKMVQAEEKGLSAMNLKSGNAQIRRATGVLCELRVSLRAFPWKILRKQSVRKPRE